MMAEKQSRKVATSERSERSSSTWNSRRGALASIPSSDFVLVTHNVMTDTELEIECPQCGAEYGVPDSWRCFHCDEVFTDREAAEQHFGHSEYCDPACRISRERFEALQFEVERYREEDGPKDREMAHMCCKHVQALRAAEEEGYFKGLQDGEQLATEENDQALPQAGRENL